MRTAPLSRACLSARTSDDGHLIVPTDFRLRRPLASSADEPREGRSRAATILYLLWALSLSGIGALALIGMAA
ncbi:hypothetical protein [Methylobacterium nodulans]|uniref:Uncharacterized protein n=1 Tax=Methylobacterium nodulans (strain LMG 21967 / CNCM I-2342 / ORS 2060) TaxID=460265 RepID=B8IRS3_METNO|nr:hypothetical protein [Methylobacterium nodulans]ACL60623.1 hypothetical protein Mnod_5794 [Methylobacterium nodulans ORS 2060]